MVILTVIEGRVPARTPPNFTLPTAQPRMPNEGDWLSLPPNQTLVLRRKQDPIAHEQRLRLPPISFMFTVPDAIGSTKRNELIVGGRYSQISFHVRRNTVPEYDLLTVTCISLNERGTTERVEYTVLNGWHVYLRIDWGKVEVDDADETWNQMAPSTQTTQQDSFAASVRSSSSVRESHNVAWPQSMWF